MTPQGNNPNEASDPGRRLELMRALLAKRGGAGADPSAAEAGSKGSVSSGAARIAPRAGEGPPPLSFAQERLWFFDRLSPGSAVFNIPALYRFEGPVDPERLRAALAATVARHDTLRARFELGDQGRPVQVIAPPSDGWIALETLEGDRRGLLERARAFVRRPFDLTRGPLLRVALDRSRAPGDSAGAVEHHLVLSIHHAISEVQSLGVFARDLATAYAGELPAPLQLQFPDFAAWQRSRSEGGAHAEQLDWWTERLRGLQPLQLPTDRARPAVQEFAGATVSRELPRALAERLRGFAREEKTTLFAVALAAFATVLGRRCRTGDVPIGAPMTDRDRPELEDLIGFFVSTLVLRCDLSGEPGFRELVKRCTALALDARERRDLPFEHLVEALAPKRDLSRSPLFQVALLLQNESEAGASRLELAPDLTLEPAGDPLALHTGTSKFDLSLIVWSRADGGLGLSFEYSTALFERGTVEAMLGHLETFLAGAVAAPDAPVASIDLLTAPERELVLERWNATARPIPAETPVHEQFEAAADRDPGALAVAEGERRMTYGELDAAANALARRLIDLGVGPGELVAMCTERHLELAVGILATLKAGGAYVPIDLAYPSDRLAYMLGDAQAKVVLTRAELAPQLPAHEGTNVAFDALELLAAEPSAGRPGRIAGGRDLAYVIYTSGSTGRPKGVELEHRGLCNLLTWHRRAYDVEPADRATHLAGLAFDASVWEVWPYLTAGASLHLVPDEVRLSPSRLLSWFDHHRITQAFVPTPLAEAVLKERLPAELSLAWMLTGGDKLHAPPPAGTPFRLVNHYGPTENSVVATCAEIAPASGASNGASGAASPTIGRPIDNVRVHVVDEGLRPVPVGVPGELVIGGASLARGYHGRPDLTAEKFVEDRIGGEAGERLYRTGDLVRYDPEGQIEFLGRIDGQVKIRGFRVELGEVEAVLGRHPQVADCAVRILTDARGDPQLVGYVVRKAGGEPVEAARLRTHLGASLPDYMVPAAVLFLEALPLTPNGKVDRKALPEPGPEAYAADVPFAEPDGELEGQIAAVWCELLGRERVGANTNFFELGGHSLLLAQVQVRLSEAVAPGLSVIELFQYPTVRSLAEHLAGGGDDDSDLKASRDRAATRRSRMRRRRPAAEGGGRS